MERIKIFIVEDDEDWQKAMVQFLNLEEDFLVVGAVTNKEDAVSFAKQFEFDVVLMDINLTENQIDGIYAALDILEIRHAKMIMLTSLVDEEVILKAFTAGAVQYINKTDYLKLPQVIRDTYHKLTPVEVLLKEFSRLKLEEQLKDLTVAERDVYDLIEQGYSKSQIEDKLFKTESTVKNQINKILKKIGRNQQQTSD
jgi:DNA-binding NarL/FixJ family response regulator